MLQYVDILLIPTLSFWFHLAEMRCGCKPCQDVPGGADWTNCKENMEIRNKSHTWFLMTCPSKKPGYQQNNIATTVLCVWGVHSLVSSKCGCNLKNIIFKNIFRHRYLKHFAKYISVECHGSPMAISQQWFGISAVDKPKFMGRPPDHLWWKTGLPESFLGCPNYFERNLLFSY